MKLFLEVVEELLLFVYHKFLPRQAQSEPILLLSDTSTAPVTRYIPSSIELMPIPFSSQGRIGFCVTEPTRIFARPLWSFDGVISLLSYGDKVQIVSYEGRFARIGYDSVAGWVLKDDLTTDATVIYPIFESGHVYSALDDETKKLRRLIRDEFFTEELYIPLQAGELVAYRLQAAGRTITWSSVRPRLPGSWHEILRGSPGVSISITPRTGSVIEGYQTTQEPFLGYVTAVDPENTITFEVVGLHEEGKYEQLSVKQAVWQEWRPVFIQLN